VTESSKYLATVQAIIGAMMYLVMAAFMMVGMGVGAQKFLAVANVSDPSKLPLTGGIFSGINQGIDMGSVALVVAFVALIIMTLLDAWEGFGGENGFIVRQ